ncbi:MAG: aminotransferase class V-fold PLP-dependent enzyme, partial [Bacteroidota bacterium]
ALLTDMPPYQGGGEMIQAVSLTHTTYNELPYKFEAGTPHIAGIIAWKEALDFIQKIGHEKLWLHESKLLSYALDLLNSLRGVRLVGTASERVGIISFTIEGLHHLDAGLWLDAEGIAVRTGHSCTQPLIDFLGIEGVVRASLAVYNTKEEIEQLGRAVEKIIQRKT